MFELKILLLSFEKNYKYLYLTPKSYPNKINYSNIRKQYCQLKCVIMAHDLLTERRVKEE